MSQIDVSIGTYLSNLFNPQVVADLIDTKLTDNMVFAPLAKLDYTLQGRPGDTVTLPYYAYIGAASSVSEGYDIPITQMTQTTTTVAVQKFAKAVQLTDEAILSGYGDPLGEAANQIAVALADRLDIALLAALAANVSEAQNYATSDSTTALAPEDVPKALAKFGEDMDGEKALVVPPSAYADFVGKNWIPASEIAANVRIRGAVGMAYGCQLIVSNRLTSSGNWYIIKPNTLAVFFKRGSMIEADRDIINQSTVLAGSIIAAPYLLKPAGMVKMSVGS